MMYRIVEVSRERSLTDLVTQSLKQLCQDTLWLEERRGACADSPWFDLAEASLEEQQRDLARLYVELFEERRRHRRQPVEVADPADSEVELEAAVDRIAEVISCGLTRLTELAQRAG